MSKYELKAALFEIPQKSSGALVSFSDHFPERFAKSFLPDIENVTKYLTTNHSHLFKYKLELWYGFLLLLPTTRIAILITAFLHHLNDTKRNFGLL